MPMNETPYYGQISQCSACNQPIVWSGKYWDHTGDKKPRHIAKPKEPMQIKICATLPVVNCCASCEHMHGWFDNSWCSIHNMEVRPYTYCSSFARQNTLPDYVELRRTESE